VSFLFPQTRITFDAAMRDLARGSPRGRAMAAHALGDVTEPTEKRRAVDALVIALDDDRPEVRAEACASLGDLGDPGAVVPLVKRLDDGHAAVRQNAAIALGTLRDKSAFQPLADALASGPADLRFQAATSLAEIDPPRAYDLLVPALGDRDPQVVAAAALALGAIGDQRARDAIRAHLDDADAATRFDVAYALAELGDDAGRAALVAALADEGRAWDAVTALGWLDAVAELAAALVAKQTPAEASVLAAGQLLRIDATGEHAASARRVLVAALAARKLHVRGLAIEQLTTVGGAWATAPLEKLARSGKGAGFLEGIAAALRAIAERAAP
jgi:HEAT repeat protein